MCVYDVYYGQYVHVCHEASILIYIYIYIYGYLFVSQLTQSPDDKCENVSIKLTPEV